MKSAGPSRPALFFRLFRLYRVMCRTARSADGRPIAMTMKRVAGGMRSEAALTTATLSWPTAAGADNRLSALALYGWGVYGARLSKKT